MENRELKPCPFCGRTNQRFLMDMDIYNYPQNKGRRAIICDCGLRLYASDHGEAEKKWQNRLYDEFIKELASENERLRDTAYRLACEVHRERADTVKEFAERLKQVLRDEGRSSYYFKATIDQFAKEMLDGKDET